MKEVIQKDMADNCFSSSLTLNTRSSCNMKVLMALTAHFFIKDFFMRSYMLEAKQVQGRHNGEMMKSVME
jgi:hypothetical protein